MNGSEQFHLEKGLWLEDAETLLPWNSSPEELSLIADGDLTRTYGRSEIVWRRHQCFDGLDCMISTSFDRPPEICEKYSVNVTELKQLGIHPHRLRDETVFQQYDRVHHKFTSLFGAPTRESIDDMNYPFTEWNLKDVLLAHFIYDRFGPVLATELWRQPLPPWRAGNSPEQNDT